MRKFNLESIQFLVPSAQNPKVKAGESSDSNLLNRYFKSLSQDISSLTTRTSLLASYCQRSQMTGSAQAGAIQAMITALNARVDAIIASGSVLADLHSNDYINSSSTAEVSTVFGQATLPIRETVDLLVQTDAYGNNYVSDLIKLSYAVTSTSSEPSSLDFREDPAARDMLKGERGWIYESTVNSSQYIWLRLDFPFEFLGREPNVLELWPIPPFTMDLLEVSYHEFGASLTSSWQTLDLTYLPGYNETLFGNTYVNNFGPIRLHLPTDVSLSSLRFKLKVRSGISYWGVHQIKLYHFEYDDTATLVLENPYGFSLSSLYIKGKDPDELADLSSSIVTSTATITLTSNDPRSSPIITGVILQE